MPVNVSDFQWDENQLRSVRPLSKPTRPRRVRKRFIKGPIPLDWMETAARLPGKATQAAVAIWFRHGLTHGGVIRFTRRLAQQFGIGRKAVTAALTNLETAGLISVLRPPGCAPRVKVLEAASKQSSGPVAENNEAS